ncbi:hypothetical protein K438DRAFT_1802728 [Mycena galopus ATCC 62051]|nr:hypothetical protein K438DRAFT_1802728 [Mycena galopus ATCC 62051]
MLRWPPRRRNATATGPVAGSRLEPLPTNLKPLASQVFSVLELLPEQNLFRGNAKTTLEHRRPDSGMDCLPTELLCEIFALTLPHTRCAGRRIIDQAPWKLGLVCRRWRAAALNSPELWSRITLHFARSIRPERVYPLPMLETHVLRSGDTLLEVVIEVHGVNDYDKRIMELLLGHSRRWETFRLRVWGTPPGALLNCLRPVKGNLPLLRSLEFTCTDDVAHGPTLDMFSIAPNLKEVSFIRNSNPLSVLPPTVDIPWSQIVRFHGYYSSEKAGLNILKIAGPALVECAMTFTNGQKMMLNQHYPAIFLPKLRRLRLTTSGNFLNFIIAPRLEELWISDSALRLILPFLKRSSCDLQKLVIYHCTSPASLIPILEGLLTLTTLFVLFAPAVILADELFEALTITGSPASVCPLLSTVGAGGQSWIDPESFLNMVRSRLNDDVAAARLSFVSLSIKQERSRCRTDISGSVKRIKEKSVDARLESDLETWLIQHMSF